MAQPEFQIACVATDRSRPVASGEVSVEGCSLRFRFGEPEVIFREALRDGAYEITELSMASHIATVSRGTSRYIGVPVFLSRAFRHGAIYVRTDAGLEELSSLRGRAVGVPEYQQTAAMWLRGMMLEEGVPASDVRWHVGGLNAPGGGERIKLDLPEAISVRALAGDETLEAMLLDGRLDAIISPRMPESFARGDTRIRRLFPDVRAAEVAYYRATGFFPIMHCLAVRRDVADANPWLPAALFHAFARAKRLRLGELAATNVLRVSLPWILHDLRETLEITHGDPWSYGFARNRREIETMTRYAHADGIAVREVAANELFDLGTLGLSEEEA